MTKNCMFCFIDILFVILLMYYNVQGGSNMTGTVCV